MNKSTQREPTTEEMISYLRNHFRYFTMNSWNKVRSYARNVKIYRLGLTHEQESKAYELLDAQGTFDSINEIMHGFDERYNYQYQMRFNGRSGGYIVLYQGGTKPSGYQSHCTECGQLNFKKVLPTAETQEDKLRNYIRAHNLWTPQSYPGNPEVIKLGLENRLVMEIAMEIKTEFQRTGIDYTSDNKCGKCGAFARVNFVTTDIRTYTQPGKGMDENADYEEWSDDHLKSRYELIRDFDMAVDDCTQAFKELVDNYRVVEKEVPCMRIVKVLEPIAEEAGL